MRALLLALAAAGVVAVPALAAGQSTGSLRAGAEAVRDRALHDPTAYDFVESVSVDVGQRLAGTEAAARARDWGVAKLKALGFSDVHVEPFPITAWIRGPESAEIVSPHPQSLAIIGLGGSVPTPPGGVEAEIALFHTYADLLAAPPGSLKGKIAVVTQPMARTEDGSGYGADNPPRRQGPSEAAKRGAIAYLVRSLATGVSREPHTGALNYEPGVPEIPAAALSVVDSNLIDHLARRGAPIRIHLSLASTSRPATAWTVEGEIPGTVHPEEIVQVGGHLDSWDPGTGSIDDGAGMAIAVAAAHLAGTQNPPKRTIRVALFGAEEMDFSRFAFAKAHMAEAPRIVVIG
ncbi:MAG: M28 family peptidase, partial [Caulobacteraceae bacterium]